MWSRFTRPSRWTLLVPALLGTWIAFRFWQAAADDPQSAAPEGLPEGEYRALEVLAGDELIVGPLTKDDSSPPAWQARIRLLGVVCPPSSEKCSDEAMQLTREFCAPGQIHLRFDKQRRTRGGGLVAYVSHGERPLNEELLRAGLGKLTLPSGGVLILERQLRQAETAARTQKSGLWSGG
jgi:endonuclease YncB( thermonuclease family)